MLLKNNDVLPLDAATVRKVAVIGPNAKVAQIMGGGSAQLNPHYAVSPYQGLVAALGEDRLVFAEGCTNRRFEPLLTSKFDVEYFNSPDLSGEVVYRDEHTGGEAFLVGAIGGGAVDPASWSARFTTQFTPEQTGDHRVGVASAGYARVLIDGKLVTENWKHWRKGRTYFEEGSDEVVGTIHLQAGKTYTVALEFGAKPAVTLTFSAFRIGIGMPLGRADIAKAVEAAKSAEVAVVCVGRSGEWDTEGSDLLDIKLPGRQDELVQAVAAVNRNTIVVLQTGGPVEMPWIDDVAAVLRGVVSGPGGRQCHCRCAGRGGGTGRAPAAEFSGQMER